MRNNENIDNRDNVTECYIFQLQFEMEIENGAYLTEIETNTQIPKEPMIKFKRQNLYSQNQCSVLSIRKNTPIKIDSMILKQNKLKYKQYPGQEYYEGKLLKPGTQIYKIIMDMEEKRTKQKNIPILKVKFPSSVIMDEGGYSLINSQKGYVQLKNSFTLKDLLELLDPTHQTQAIHPKLFPAALLASGSSSVIEHQIFLSNQIYPKLLPKSQNQACIKYVQPFGNYPNVLRIFYHPKRNKNWKPNIGYKIVNKKKIDDDIMNRKHKQIHNYIIKDYEKQQKFNITIVKGKALVQLQQMTQSLIQYLQSYQNAKITQIVVDYTFGKDRKYYFHEIRCIKSHQLTKKWDIGDNQEILELVQQKINQVSCKLCGLYFRKQQVCHKVTKKLIYELISHLKIRGQNIQSFNSNTIHHNSFSNSCHVCQICYQLILAQHELIDIQQQFSSLLNIDLDPLNRVPQLNKSISHKKKISNLNKGIISQSALKTTEVYQWRIFFYLQKIKNLPNEIQDYTQMRLSLKCKGFQESFFKKINEFSVKQQNILLSRPPINQFDIYDKKTQHTTYTYNTNRTQDQSGAIFKSDKYVDLQKVKVFVFYTKTPDIIDFIEKEELYFQMSLINGKKGTINPFKMKGQSSTMRNFVNTQRCQQHSCQVLLFDQRYKYCSLEVNIGLKFDKIVSEDQLSLLDSDDDFILYPNGHQNRICTPLPQQWIQMINNGQGKCMLQQIPEESDRLSIPKKQTKFGYISCRMKKHKKDQSLDQARISMKKKNSSRRQSVRKIHSRPQTCFLSESSRESVKRSKFNRNLFNDNSLSQVTSPQNNSDYATIA